MSKLTSAFRKFTNAPKSISNQYLLVRITVNITLQYHQRLKRLLHARNHKFFLTFPYRSNQTYDPINRHEAILWFATATLLTFQAEFIPGK